MSSTKTETTKLVAPDIVCGGCVSSIRNALGPLEGVRDVQVDVATKTVTVSHADPATRAAIVEALDGAGFPTVTA